MTARNINIPALRFKEYSDNWIKKELGDICTFYSGGTPSSTNKKFYSGSIPFIGSGNIYDSEVSTFITEEALNSSSAKMVDEGDLLYALYGANSGEVAISKITGAINQAILCIRSDFEYIPFLYSLLLCNKDKIVSKYLQGGQGNLSAQIIKKLRYYFPSLPEQQKIASFLSAVDEKILQLTRKKELMEQYKQGVMQKLFSGKLRFKDEKGRAYPEWEEKRLGDVCVVNPKNNGLPDSFIYIDLESVEKGQLKRENRINREDAPSRAQRSMNKNDILYQTVRPYQMNNLFFDKPGEYVASTGYAQLRTNENARFIYQILHTDVFVNEVLDRCTGTSFPAIKSSDLAQIVIGIPQIYEQNKIATFLSSIDAKIEGIGNQINKSQMFKKGLLQQMFV